VQAWIDAVIEARGAAFDAEMAEIPPPPGVPELDDSATD
jgi:hypothetical protein